MNTICHQLVRYIEKEAPKHNKKQLEDAVVRRFSLTKDRKVFHNNYFAVRFSYSKSSSNSFSNTVLSLSALEKYDSIPFFVILVRQSADNLILLSNSTFLKKVSHSSQELRIDNIKGSFNGSDIMREYEGVDNIPDNFDFLFDIHAGLDWEDNLFRLVEATTQIRAIHQKYSPSQEEMENIFDSINRAKRFIQSEHFNILENDLNERCAKCKNEILIASHIENSNIRGRLIESLITADDEKRKLIINNLKDLEAGLPTYDVKNGLGDYFMHFDDEDTYTDIKTKIVYLNSNPKAYNIDKFLMQMSDTRSVFLFYFIGVDENSIFKTLLCSVFHDQLLDNTILQFHWAGRQSRGVAQFNGSAIDKMLRLEQFSNNINNEKSKTFLQQLLSR